MRALYEEKGSKVSTRLPSRQLSTTNVYRRNTMEMTGQNEQRRASGSGSGSGSRREEPCFAGRRVSGNKYITV